MLHWLERWHSFLPDPVLVSLGPVAVHWYGLWLAFGLLAGYALTLIRWRELGRLEAELDKLVLAAVVFGFWGARLVDVLWYERWYFIEHPWDAFKIWQGGLAWHGALIVFIGLVWWWAKRQVKFSAWQVWDVFAPGLALGQAVGRWGNYFNQELFGRPTSLPWGIPIASQFRPFQFSSFTYFHPVFLYESLGLLLIAYALWRVRHILKNGQLFALYLMASGGLRLALEFVRVDEQDYFWGIRAGQIVGLVVLLAGLVLWWWRNSEVAAVSNP